MKKAFLAVALSLVISLPSLAQDWVDTPDGGAAYDCTLIGAMAADLGARAIARVEDDLYSLIEFFAIIVPDCKPANASPPAFIDPNQETDWTKSAMHQSEYDCSALSAVFDVHGDESLVEGESDVRYTVREVFASLVPDCVPEVDTGELLSRIGSDQGWAEGKNSYYEFNCDYFGVVMAEYGGMEYLQSGQIAHTYTLAEYYQLIAPLCKARDGLSRKSLAAPLDSAWIKDAAGGSAINCPLVKRLLSEYGIQDYIRGGGEVWSNFTYYQNIFPACIPSNVIASDALTLRECAETSCGSVGAVSADTVLEIVGIDGAWYEVKLDAATAFVPIERTITGGYPILQPFDGHEFEEHSCFIWTEFEQSRDMDFKVFDLSERRRDAIVDIYQPIRETGIYVIEVTLGETSGRVGLDVHVLGTYSVYLGGC